MEALLEDNELGRIEIWRSERATRIKILIKPDHLRITLPMRATQQQGLDFLNQVRTKIKQKQKTVTARLQSIDEEHPLQTLSFVTNVQVSDREKVFFRLQDGVLLIEYPRRQDPGSEQMQTFFKNGIDFFLRKEAKRLLPGRLAQLAKQHGFTFTDVKIQSSKTRWGSCSGRKSINLSYFLLTLPAPLIDYVLLHELCHTVEMNHGDRFWKLMDKVTDNKAKALRAEVKKHRCAL
ncbi:MAG: SprT family zinc-dependent metalloprotease [Paludibacteraceae bacterium]|nr:SprT family zinc-dependent metalloprotease [Paludibacteraceae bacterium]